MMKAMVYKHYGSINGLTLKEVPIPVPKDNQVLIKIISTSLNLSDYECLMGEPFWARIGGLFTPAKPILGTDIAGIVEKVGPKATFNVGDHVLGDILYEGGGFAEYVCTSEDNLVIKPTNLSFEQASCLPQSSTIALQTLEFPSLIKSGQKVLYHGGGGSCGTFGIQIAKSYGAHVTAIDNTEKQDYMKEMGADQVIDFTNTDFSKTSEKYDLIVDFVGKTTFSQNKDVLADEGTYLLVGASVSRLFAVLTRGVFERKKKMTVFGHKQNKKDLARVLEMVESGQLKIIIDRIFKLEELPDAFRYFATGQIKGKIVIKIADFQ